MCDNQFPVDLFNFAHFTLSKETQKSFHGAQCHITDSGGVWRHGDPVCNFGFGISCLIFILCTPILNSIYLS